MIKELIKYIDAFNDVVGRINIDYKENKFIYILEFEISEKELDSFKEKINSYKINELDITCNNYPLESCKETKEINRVAVTMKQNQFPLDGQSLYFRNSNDFYIFEKNAILKLNSIEIDNIDLFGTLNQLFYFIFDDDKTYYEKLIIFRNIFSEFIKRQNTISNTDFQYILKDLQSNYNLFITDKLKKFISDKQKVTEDFSKLQKEILVSIKNISNTLSQQFLVLIITILTTFVFKNFNTRLAMSLTVYSGIFYLICIIIVNKVRGWDFDSKSIKSECDDIDKNYNMLYSIDKHFIITLKESNSYKTELKRLEKIETLYKRLIYSLLCSLIVILILVYKHNELYDQINLYKKIVDLLLP